MAHRIGLNDTVYEPDIHDQSKVDFSFFDDSEESEERTKGQVQLCDSSNSKFSIKRNGFSGTGAAECSSVVNGAAESSGSSYNSLSSQPQLISAKPKHLLEDTSCVGQGGTTQPEQSGWCLGARSEGHQEDPLRPPPPVQDVQGNVSRSPSGSGSGVGAAVEYAGATEGAEAQLKSIGSDPPLEGATLAAQPESAGQAATDMDRADLNQYSSDEWEDSEISDSASDHSDSSDDDDPKSQVDRLIERGTRLYMDGTDSNVSESDSSDDDDDTDFSDSESDITDVSPLVSGACSPLRLSPTMSRRTKTCRSPLAIHDNKNLEFEWPTAHQDQHPHSSDQGYESTHNNHINNSSYHHDNHDDPTDMTLLLQAVIELEKTQHKSHQGGHHNHRNHSRASSNHPHNNHHQISSPHQPLSSIHASPHTRHLSTPRRTHGRKNMSFTNEEVRRIDRENQILLQKIMTAHTASKRKSGPVHKPSNSSITRKREEDKIRRENMILLRKIQEAKPSRDVAATTTRSPRYHHHHHRPSSAHYQHHHHHHHIGSAGSSSNSGNSHNASSAGTGSCSASARSAGSHGVGVATTTSRKETAL